MMKLPHVITAALIFAGSTISLAQSTTTTAPAAAPAELTPDQILAAQKEAMKAVSWMDGVWRGTAKVMGADGKQLTITHTERVGSFLDGTIKVIEGRSYDADGKVPFNAFAILSYDARAKKYEFRTYSGGNAGTFDYTLPATGQGYAWEVPAGPNQTVKYVATLKDGVWEEIGHFNAPNQPAVQIFDMQLKRVGDTDWPLTTPVPAK